MKQITQTSQKIVRSFAKLASLSLGLLLTGCIAVDSPANKAYLKGLRAEKGEISADPLECFNQAIELDPNQSSFYRARADLNSGKGEFELALKDLDKAISLSPQWWYLYYERGYCKCSLGDYKSALEDFDKAIKAQPDNVQYYTGSALAYLAMQKPDDALKAMDKVTKAAPRCQPWHYQKGIVLSRMDRKDAAVAEFNKTAVCTIVGKDNKQEDVYCDGEMEYKKAQALSIDQLIGAWKNGYAQAGRSYGNRQSKH